MAKRSRDLRELRLRLRVRHEGLWDLVQEVHMQEWLAGRGCAPLPRTGRELLLWGEGTETTVCARAGAPYGHKSCGFLRTRMFTWVKQVQAVSIP